MSKLPLMFFGPMMLLSFVCSIGKTEAATLSFQEGTNNYTGTQDKEIRSSGNDENNGQNVTISIDGDDGSPGILPNHGLILFADIIGNQPNQIPAQSTINSASLILDIVSRGSGLSVYKMLRSWDENSTWATDFGGDGITLGTDADSTALTSVGANNSSANVPIGTLNLDITLALQDWVNGNQNFGVGLLPFPNGTDGIDFQTSEAATILARPILNVDFEPVSVIPEPLTILGTALVAGYLPILKKQKRKLK